MSILHVDFFFPYAINSFVIVASKRGNALKFPPYLNLIFKIGTLDIDPFGVTNKVNDTEAWVSDASWNSIDFWQSSGHSSAKFAKILTNDLVSPCSTLGAKISEPLGFRDLPDQVTK